MIIDASSLLPHLKDKVRPTQSDGSRHIICPDCKTRTKLNTLGDGRKKCTVCGKKFRIHKVTEGNKLQQCAEILLCFCLDFSMHRAVLITHHRYPLVSDYYDRFRKLLTQKNLPKEKIELLSDHKGDIHMLHDTTRCKWCKSKIRARAADSKPPVFGVQFRESGEVYIDPLKDDEAVIHFHTFGSPEEAPGRREGYAGFICCGKFHRFTDDEKAKHGADQLWTWIRERIRNHHGIWKRNTGFYLKELEWKYNHRSLDPEVQAQKIIELMPMNFLTSWSLKTEDTPMSVQTSD
jgi:transposase